MKKIVFLVSGGGGNLKFLHRSLGVERSFKAEFTVIADRHCKAIEYANSQELSAHTVSYSKTKNKELKDLLEEKNPDLIITNWHKIIDEEIVRNYRGRMINLHYSLLPAFGGLIGIDPIKKAYEQGCKYIGPTCHWVDEGTDTGRIISQAIFATNRSIEDATEQMFRSGCLILLSTVINLLFGGNPKVENSDHCRYLPPLAFDESEFDSGFWSMVKSL